MKKCDSYIRLFDEETNTSLAFDFVHSVEIERTWKRLTDTCTIQLPRKILIKDTDINKALKRGMRVEVYLGYDGRLALEYFGYIARVESKIPIVLHCEDEMWKLKQKNQNLSFKNTTAKEIVQALYDGPVNVLDVAIGYYRISKANAAQVLADFKSSYGLVSYFTNEGARGMFPNSALPPKPTLNVGFAYSFRQSNKLQYDFNKNIADNNLEYKLAQDKRLLVKGISVFGDNSKIEVERGDKDGEQRTLHYYNIQQKALIDIVDSQISLLRKTGYSNDMTTFGEPYADHNDIAVITDAEYPERAGSYLIDAVKVQYSFDNGFKRVITLGNKV